MTQCERILSYMQRYGSISTMEAFKDLGCTRLASRINDLKNQGYAIKRRIRDKQKPIWRKREL